MADLAQCDDTIRPHLQGLFDAAMESLQAQCEVRRRCECCATCDVFEVPEAQIRVLERIYFYFDINFIQQFIPKGSIDNKSSLIQVMVLPPTCT